MVPRITSHPAPVVSRMTTQPAPVVWRMTEQPAPVVPRGAFLVEVVVEVGMVTLEFEWLS